MKSRPKPRRKRSSFPSNHSVSPSGPRRFDKLAFFASLGYEPHHGQLQIHQSNADRRIVACGVRFGKTKAAAYEGLAAAMLPNKQSIGWVCAPTYELADKVFREIIQVANEKLRHRVITLRESDRLLVLRNVSGGTSEIRGKSADNPVSLLGEGLDWLIVDEAARLKPTIWEGHLSQRLIDKRGWALLISTPKGKGWFYDLFRRGQDPLQDQFASWNLPSWTNPHINEDYIHSQRALLPDRVFAQEYEAQFTEGAGAVFRNIRACTTGRMLRPNHRRLYYAGLDIAKVEDYTVLIIIDEDRRVVFMDRFNRVDWSLQLARIKHMLELYNDAAVLIDSTGLGEPIYEAMRLAGVDVQGYSLSLASKAALINNLAMMLERKQIMLPSQAEVPVLIDELEGYTFSVTEAGNVSAAAPRGQHDDCVIALALAAWQVRTGSGRSALLPLRGF